MYFKKSNYKSHSDNDLSKEITWAQRQVHYAFESRRKASNQTSEAGLLTLDENVAFAECYLNELLAEQQLRINTGLKIPDPVQPKKTVIKLQNAPKVAQPNPSKRVHPSYSVDEETERPPIIVFDRGVPRAWRPGDPIY